MNWTGTIFRLGVAAIAAILVMDLIVIARSPSFWMIPAGLIGWYAADLASGAVHLYMDYKPTRAGLGLDRLFFYEGSRESAEYIAMRDAAFRQLGPIERLIYDFKNHHPRPDALGRRSMLHQIGSTVLFTTLPFTLLATIAFFVLAPPAWVMAGVLAFVIGATFAQYFHGTLHRAENPRLVHALRAARLLMRPEDHVVHHETLTQDFSTINGWSNPLLNFVFRSLRRRGHLPDEGLVPR